jgi:hypothetical protein
MVNDGMFKGSESFRMGYSMRNFGNTPVPVHIFYTQGMKPLILSCFEIIEWVCGCKMG